MLLHIIPRLYVCQSLQQYCELIDFSSPELGVTLNNNVELVARRLYPNKNFLVACRKVGQKAMNGFMIETDTRVREFTGITRWEVAKRVVTHKVQYLVLDEEFDAISEDMVFWHGPSNTKWRSRWPEIAKNWTPASAQPRMELSSSARDGIYSDRHENGNIVERTEVFHLRTIERERITDRLSVSGRTPAIAQAFHAEI